MGLHCTVVDIQTTLLKVLMYLSMSCQNGSLTVIALCFAVHSTPFLMKRKGCVTRKREGVRLIFSHEYSK